MRAVAAPSSSARFGRASRLRRTRRFRGRWYPQTVDPVTNRRAFVRSPPLLGLNDRHFARLRYCVTRPIDPIAGGIAIDAFRANSFTHPCVASTTHTPLGFDEWSNFYQHYTVLGSSLTAKFINAGTSNLLPAVMGVAITSTSTELSLLTGDNILEQKHRSDVALAGIVQNGAGPSQTGMSQATINFSSSRFFGTKNLIGLEPYRASFISDPTEEAFFTVFALSVGGNNPGAIHAQVTIEYIVCLSEPRALAESVEPA